MYRNNHSFREIVRIRLEKIAEVPQGLITASLLQLTLRCEFTAYFTDVAWYVSQGVNAMSHASYGVDLTQLGLLNINPGPKRGILYSIVHTISPCHRLPAHLWHHCRLVVAHPV